MSTASSNQKLRVLNLEDDDNDSVLIRERLKSAGLNIQWRRADDEASYTSELQAAPDLIIADFQLPGFSALRALEILNSRGDEIPLILVSGTIGEEAAVKAIHLGAFDYVSKNSLIRLPHVIERALERKEALQEKLRAEAHLRQSENYKRAILESALDAIIAFDASGRLVEFNAAAERIFGFKREEVLGKQMAELVIPPEFRAEYKTAVAHYLAGAQLRQVLISGSPEAGADQVFQSKVGKIIGKRCETTAVRKDGSSFPIELTISEIAEAEPPMFASVVRDITERKAAENKLRLQAQVLDQVGQAVLATDVSGSVIYANHSALELFGLEASAVLQLNLQSIGIEEIPLDGADVIRSRLEKGETWHGELAVAWRNGQRIPALGSVSALRDRDGKVTGTIRVYTDITERKRAEESLRESEERFRMLSKATNDAIWDLNITASSVWFNRAYGTLFGYSSEDVHPQIEWWQTKLHPEDRERVLESFHKAINTKAEHWSCEYRFRRNDGTYANVLDRGYVIRDRAGAAVRMVGGMTDLTEIKRSEERLAQQAALLDVAREAILDQDLEGHIIFWNRGAERIYGWTAEETIGRRITELSWSSETAHKEALSHVLANGEWEGEIAQRTKDGRIVTVLVRWTLVRDSKGCPKSILSINNDITEKKKLENQFLRAQRLESIGVLAGGIAHDLNNILAPILMSIEILGQQIQEESGLELLATLKCSAERGADLVRQVLSFARGIEGKRISVNPSHIIREVQKIIRDTFPKNISVTLRLPKEPWLITGDPTQVHQVLMNLCVNARDAMPNGGRLALTIENVLLDEIYARLNPNARAGRYVVITVADTGAGIPVDLQEKIFEPFFTTKDIGAGTGLGLSTTQGIVKSHYGFVQLESQVGKGSEFKVYLPASVVQAAAATPSKENAASLSGHGELVLVVDDEEAVRVAAKMALERFGYRVAVASNGAEAVSIYALRSGEVAVVILDMAMPIMDGPATIVALRSMNPRIRIIASSGLPSDERTTSALESGVEHFISKPYTGESLLTVLREVFLK